MTSFSKYLEETTASSPVTMLDAVKLAETLVRFADKNNSVNLTGDLGKAVKLAREFIARYKNFNK